MKTLNTVLCCTLFVLLGIANLSSQNLTGKIVDKNNQPAYGSTIFIKELNQGLACNDDGEFQANLPVGNYTIEYRCLGYENVIEKITVGKDDRVTRNIVLKEKTFELAQVVVTNKEDPAYEIIRQAIKKAPYYRNVVKRYKAEAYIKGNLELTKVSKIMDKLAGKDEGLRMSDFKDKLFVQESFNEIEFTAPDKYTQTVKGFSSSAPDDFNPKEALRTIQTSLYDPTSQGGIVSPLHPKSFSYYRFRYEGFTEEDGETINKIKIIPKLKDPSLMSGYIYIADRTWDIRNAQIETNTYGIKQEITITYNKVLPDIYLPIAYNNQVLADIMGIGGNMNYSSSVKYIEIIPNDSVNEAINNKPKKKGFEIKHDENYVVKDDTLATKRDSIFWSDIRNVPLSDKELASYTRRDSVQHRVDSIRKDFHHSKFKPSDLLWGGKIGGDSTKFRFKFDGLLKCMPEYNFVDGFWLGQEFEIATKFKKHNRLIVSPQIYYTTARKKLIWKTDLSLTYAPMRLGNLSVSGGDVSADYNPLDYNRFDNTLSSIFTGKNVLMLYRKRFAKMMNEIDLVNGVRLISGFEIAKRTGLHNNTTYTFFNTKKKIKDNLYQQGNFDLAAYHLGLAYTPRHYYSVDDGKKTYRYAKSPTMYAIYSEGFSSWFTNNSRFKKIRGGIYQNIKTEIFSSVNYNINGGAFLGNKDKINFADYQHFNATNLFLVTRNLSSLFMLLDRYEASTNKYWIDAHIDYNSRYIFLKRLPFLQGKLFGESLHLKYLYTPTKKNYMETGYSIDLFKTINLGVFCSFDKMKYDGAGIRLALNLWMLN